MALSSLGYWRGQTVPFHRVWTTDSDNDATGTTVTLTLGGPLGQVVLPTVSGIAGPIITVDAEYQIPDDAGAVGFWSARWELAGTIVEAAEDIFYVKRSLTNANDPGSGLVGTPALQLLAALLTVDGAGSLLDADKLDGLDSTAFATPASTTAAIVAHSAAADPHADRAFATSAIATAIANLVNAAPGTLDTLNELALALGSDPNFATTITNALAGKQPLDSDLTAIAALVSAADKLPYATGAGTWSLTDLTAFARTLLDDANAAAARTTLGLGTAATTAATDYQPVDTELTALASTTSAANKLPYFTGSGTATTTDLTAAGRAIIDDADATAQRTTLGLGTAATNATGDFQAADAELAAIAGLTSAANKVPYFTGSGTASVADFTAAGRALVDDADAAAQLVTLSAAHLTQVDVYTVAMGATVWNKPSWAVAVEIHAIAGGGGGGSGRKGAAGTVRCGGGGGGGGSWSVLTYAASDLPSSLTATAGAGGAGGASVSAADTNGNNGVAGTISTVVNGSVIYVRAGAAGFGGGGTNAAGTAGNAATGFYLGAAGTAASTTGLVGVAGGNASGAGGGGSGGGITTGDAAVGGGNGGQSNARTSGNVPVAGGVGGAGGSGASAGEPTIVSSPVPGHGGAGGGSSIAAIAGVGGAGGFPGGGGGGGGASLNAVGDSGAGGTAGNGLVVIISRG